MAELRYIRLPNPTRREWTGEIGTDLDRAVAVEEDITSDTIVYSARNRFRPAPKVASDPAAVLAGHASPRDSNPVGSSWGKVHRSVSAALQHMQQRLRRSSSS